MKNVKQYTGILENVQRYDTSYNGNPRYSAEIDGRLFFTGVDSMHGYSITNYDGKQVSITAGMHYGKLTIVAIEEA